MRRGGGSRGGSFGGGSRGFGGSSFRHSRTSRRHHRHHRHYYGPRYYGRPYYRRRGYYGGPTNPAVGIWIFGIILMIVVPLIVASATTGSTVATYDLDPGTTSIIDYSSALKGGVDIDVTAGQVTTYFFDNEPELSRTIPRYLNYSGEEILEGDFQFFTIYLTEGSTITTTWEFTESISYHLVRGKSNFDSWEAGEDTQIYDNFGSTGVHDFTAGVSDTYYFIFWNNLFITTNMISVEFDYNIKAHDISNPNSQISGSVYLNPSQIDGRYLVFYNPNALEAASVTVEIFSRFSYSHMWFATFLGILIGTIYFANRASKSFHERREKKKQQNKIEQKSGETKSSSDFYQRPKPEYCPSCGSPKLPNSKFCTDCGVAF